MNNNNIHTEVKDTIDDIFIGIPLDIDSVIKLPSGNLTCKGEVTLRPLKFEDEKFLIQSRKSKAQDNTLNLLLGRCLTGVDVQDLLPADKLFLVLQLRAISYGDDYKSIAICPKCNEENDISIKLTDLPVEYLPENTKDPREITLPKTKKKVKVRFPRVSDEAYMKDEETFFNNIWRFILSVEGREDKTIISAFLDDKRLSLQDVAAIGKAIVGADYGVSTKIKYECTGCKSINILDLQLGADFFSVTA